MKKKILKITVIVEAPFSKFNKSNIVDLLYNEDWRDELDVIRVLKSFGHTVQVFGIYNDIYEFVDFVRKEKPDIVFNLCETFCHDRLYEADLASLCKLMGLSYTGSDPLSLHICKNKALQKEILSFHKIKIPQFTIASNKSKEKDFSHLTYPLIVKPLCQEASEGISQSSYVSSQESCMKRVEYLYSRFKVHSIVEEFIEGRELYIALIGGSRVSSFNPVELVFSKYPQGKPNIATYHAKWDNHYRKRWGISAVASSLEKSLKNKVRCYSKKIYKTLGLSGYVRFDLRLRENGDIYFIEANPNPSIAKSDDFAKSVTTAGTSYEALIERILNQALLSNPFLSKSK
ncbi:MAG: hypothetical protein CMP11_09315 [Zetaproteobacteria bacterium]|nr:hypothetical protein [Pseudobdellovibrionaceae bacterium]